MLSFFLSFFLSEVGNAPLAVCCVSSEDQTEKKIDENTKQIHGMIKSYAVLGHSALGHVLVFPPKAFIWSKNKVVVE